MHLISMDLSYSLARAPMISLNIISSHLLPYSLAEVIRDLAALVSVVLMLSGARGAGLLLTID